MVPGPRFDKPGKSPFMDMQLVPVYADEAGDAGVKISSAVQQNLGIRTASVTRANAASGFVTEVRRSAREGSRLTEGVSIAA